MRINAASFALFACTALGAALLHTPLRAAADSTFSFGPPLRPGIIFTYKCTERVKVVNHLGADNRDSSERTVTYFISERQITNSDGKGGVEIQANVDSMRIEYQGMDGSILFDTQHLKGSESIVRHREVLGPSVVVNRMATFQLSPYGQILKMESVGLAELDKELQDPTIDPFTRERVNEVRSDANIQSLLMPWRGLLPTGEKVQFGQPLKRSYVGVLDRTLFRDDAIVKLAHGPEGDKKPHLLISATLDHPLSKTTTIAAIAQPLKVTGGHAATVGDFRLDDDGVLLSGWISTTGTVSSESGPVKVTSDVVHEHHIEMLFMAPFQ